VISKSANPSNRVPGETPLLTNKYYLADNMAFDFTEKIFNLKIILLDSNTQNHINNGTFVSLNDGREAIVYDNNNNNNNITVLTSYPSQEIIHNVKISDVKIIQRTKIYNYATSDENDVFAFAFMYYSPGHYESVSLKNKYIFNTYQVPIYIVYMIFIYSYIFILRSGHIYTRIHGISRQLRNMLLVVLDTHYTHTSRGGGTRGGGKKKENSLVGGSRSNRKRYIINVTLDIFEKNEKNSLKNAILPIFKKISLACKGKYENIRKSYAMIFDIPYEPLLNKAILSEHKNNSTRRNNPRYYDYNNYNYTRKRNHYY